MEPRRTSKLCLWSSQISFPIYILIVLFAISSWIDINSMFVELPLLVNQLPEGWSLPSYLVFIIQIANVAPICFVIAVKRYPQKIKEWPFVILIISIGAVACLSLVFFWDKTTVILGQDRSTGLLSLCLLLAVTDCTSSVVYLPYMAQFRVQYITAYYIGAGLSGLIPGLMGLIQGIGGDPQCINQTQVLTNETTGMNYTDWTIKAVFKEPLFSAEIFFLLLFGMMFVSGAAFLTLHFSPFAKREHLKNTNYKGSIAQKYTLDHDYDGKPDSLHDLNHINQQASTSEPENSHTEQSDSSSMNSKKTTGLSDIRMTSFEFVILLILTGWINALTNAILPSIQSYAALPYGK